MLERNVAFGSAYAPAASYVLLGFPSMSQGIRSSSVWELSGDETDGCNLRFQRQR